jgi:hypothetical protein
MCLLFERTPTNCFYGGLKGNLRNIDETNPEENHF